MMPSLRDARIPHPREHLYLACSTICNLGCQICPYRKGVLPRQVMSHARFASVIDQACELGFEAFGLTPLIGEVFTDRQFLEKLRYLEAHPGVKSYSFITNFTLGVGEFIAALNGLKKLRYMSISVYGHDELSFIQATGSTDRVWEALLTNLLTLARTLPPAPVRTQVRIRSQSGMTENTCAPGLRKALEALRARNVPVKFPQHYYNWGGLIAEEEVEPLDVTFLPSPPRSGPCTMIFYKTIVLPDGRVNACACRDAGATLVIGDLERQTLREIFSSRNPIYARLIEEQSNGIFGAVCQACNMYRSPHDPHETYDRHLKPPITLSQFFEQF
ncbi:MAG: SPASM domain-containing protein [Gemmataceae bacterium]